MANSAMVDLSRLVLAVVACSLFVGVGCGSRSALPRGGGHAGTAAGGATSSGVAGAGGVGGAGGTGCEPQDAAAFGPCTAELPGVRFDGEHCVGLGSGCNCVGADCGSVYDTVAECVSDRMGCFEPRCDGQIVAEDTCGDCGEPSFRGAFYDGRECFELYGCPCAGPDCPGALASLGECEAVHAGCDGSRCTATGGIWLPATAGFCDFACGAPLPIACESPFSSCVCPAGLTLQPGVGCVFDPACQPRDLCLATRGVWHPASECYCGFQCGQPGDCEACQDSCDCGPHRTFDGAAGCVLDPLCPPAQPAEVCQATGGHWQDCSQGGPCSCGDYLCGFPNTLEPCVMPGCDCGPLSGFGPEGCRYQSECLFLGPGAQCHGQGDWSTSCRPGLVCCEGCGAPPGCPSCQSPCCPSAPGCGDEGCFPPPP